MAHKLLWFSCTVWRRKTQRAKLGCWSDDDVNANDDDHDVMVSYHDDDDEKDDDHDDDGQCWRIQQEGDAAV